MDPKDNQPAGSMTKIEMEMLLEQMAPLHSIQALKLKSKYDALVVAGFNVYQALYIVSTRPLWE